MKEWQQAARITGAPWFLLVLAVSGCLPTQDSPEAQYNLGVMYASGEGVPQDDAEAVRWYRMAAEQGHAEAQNNLGVMYDNGRGVTQDDAEAVRWYRIAAEQGEPRAQFNLAGMYDNGRGVTQDDAEAVRWYRIAAEQGEPRAQFNLAGMYDNGRGVTQDDAEAVRWYRIAAEQGEPRAQFNLAGMYDNGRGVTQDDAEAVRWYRIAAEQGEARAQYYLGWMYVGGDPWDQLWLGGQASVELAPTVPTDTVLAHMWFNMAGANGDARARSERERLERYMTQEDIGALPTSRAGVLSRATGNVAQGSTRIRRPRPDKASLATRAEPDTSRTLRGLLRRGGRHRLATACSPQRRLFEPDNG